VLDLGLSAGREGGQEAGKEHELHLDPATKQARLYYMVDAKIGNNCSQMSKSR
jgi:hypothetical protein